MNSGVDFSVPTLRSYAVKVHKHASEKPPEVLERLNPLPQNTRKFEGVILETPPPPT